MYTSGVVYTGAAVHAGPLVYIGAVVYTVAVVHTVAVTLALRTQDAGSDPGPRTSSMANSVSRWLKATSEVCRASDHGRRFTDVSRFTPLQQLVSQSAQDIALVGQGPHSDAGREMAGKLADTHSCV